jgi:uncharacterized membrane protein
MPKKSDSKGYAFIATFFSIVGFIVALLAWRKDKYVMYYANQSLVIFIISVIVSAIGGIISFIPILGSIIQGVLNLFVAIIWIFSWVYALSGEKKPVFLVGDYAKKINL